MGAKVADWVKPNPDLYGHVTQSDDPYLAHQLTTGREYQALFVGHLDPQDITAFWVSNDPTKDGRYAQWTRLSREAFIKTYGGETKGTLRMFSPNETFDGDEFIRRMSAKYRQDRVQGMLQNAAEHIRTSPRPADQFRSYFDNYLCQSNRPRRCAGWSAISGTTMRYNELVTEDTDIFDRERLAVSSRWRPRTASVLLCGT